MMTRNNNTALFSFTAYFAFYALLVSCSRIDERANRRKCYQQLRSIGVAIQLYRQDHADRLPDDILSTDLQLDSGLLKCHGAQPGAGIDYIYVDWSKLSLTGGSPSGALPMLYDRRMANHNMEGINILMVDGSVMWDPDAKWLKEFSAKHPKVKLAIPVREQEREKLRDRPFIERRSPP